MTFWSNKKIVWKRKMPEDYYLYSFNNGLISNKACYSCPYAQEKRIGDLSIGDFWGIGKIKPFNSPNRKVSIVTVNNTNGERFLRKCSELVLEERDYSEAIEGNSQLRHPAVMHDNYDTFWNTYSEKGIDEAIKNTIYKQINDNHKKIYRKELPKKIIKKILHR